MRFDLSALRARLGLRAVPRRRLLAALGVLLLPALVWAAARLGDEERERPIAARPSTAAVPAEVHAPPEVAALLRQGRNWQAARKMRAALDDDSPPEARLVAARAEAGWGGWNNVRDLLEGEAWLDRVGNAEGWYLLARAHEEEGEWKEAASAYSRFLRATSESAGPDTTRAVAELRQGLALLRSGQTQEGVRTLEHARAHAGPIRAWVGLLAAEALAPAGDTARVRALVDGDGEGAAPLRAQRARVAAYRKANDPAGARALALAFRARAGSDEARATLGLDAARAAMALNDPAARGELRAVMATAPASEAAGEAARLLAAMPGLSAEERLAVARVRDRRGANAEAAAGYRAWLASGAGTEAERRQVRLAMGNAFFDAGRHTEAEAALRPLADHPDAVYVMGRAQYRRGASGAARATLLGLAQRFPRTPQAANALFLVADLADDAGQDAAAAGLYRRVVGEQPTSYRAGLARMRLAGMSFLARDWAGAAGRWEEHRALGPDAPLWAQATYWAGRAYAAAGDTARANARFREVRQRQPVSYYALLSAKRLGQPYWPLALPAGPERDGGAAARVEEWLRGADLLRAAGLPAEEEAEIDRVVARAGNDAGVLYALAEGLNARGYTVPGTRLGLRLQRERGAYDARMLRILYPYPYRAIIEAEARARGLDPFLVAALTRQESTFKARIVSPVGARGLMQVMPETGRGLAAGAGLRGWDPELLFDPEINVHLGTRYLATQMRAYDAHLPYVFTAYNAGPGRVTRWRRFPEARDGELFTERIPFEETRDYVKILTRNIALYRGMYGGG